MSALTKVLRNPLFSPLRAITSPGVGGGWSPAELFGASEQGAWYAPRDLSTLFQNSMLTPVTTDGHADGLALDKRLGLVLGADTITNGDFNSATGWTLPANYSITGGKLIATSAASGSTVSRTGVVTIGEWYKATVVATSVTGGGFKMGIGGTDSTTISTAGTHTFILRAGTANVSLQAQGTSTYAIESFSAQPLPGNHAAQPTAAQKPTYRDSGFPYLSFDRAADNLIAAGGGGGTTGILVCAAIRAGGAGTARTIWSDRGTNTGYRLSINASNQLVLSAGNGSAHTEVTGPTIIEGEDYVVTGWHDGAALNVQANAGAVTSAAFGTATAGTAGFTIGKDNGAATGYYGDRLYEVVYRKNDTSSEGDRASLIAYMAERAGDAAQSNMMAVELTDDHLYSRYSWDGTYDAVQRIARNITPGVLSANGCVGPNGIKLIPVATARTGMVAAFNAAGSLQTIAEEGDSVGPMKYNGTFIAGIHGTNAVRQVTATAHGKTVGDIGSQWTSPDAVTYWLISIRDANTLWFLAASIGIDAELWRFQSSMTASGTMTYVAGATNPANITYSANSIVQLVPCVQDHTCTVLLNGTTPITANGVYDCDFAQVVETYGVANTADMLAWVIAGRPWATTPEVNDNAIATQVLCEYTYEIHDNGSMSVVSRIENLQKIDLARSNGYIGLTQANAPYWHTPGSAEEIHLYVPRVAPIVGSTKTWDYQAGEDITGTVDTLDFTAASWTDAANPPDFAAYYITTTATGVKRRGFGIGYSLLSGQGLDLPESMVTTSGSVSNGRKFYPKLVTNLAFGSANSLLPAGTIVEATAWRAPYNLDPIPEATVAAVRLFDGGAEVRLAFHENVTAYAVPVPAKLNGKTVTLLAGSENLTLDSVTVANGAITVTVTGGYGAAALLVA